MTKRERIRKAFSSGDLRVQSVSPEGEVEWKNISHVVRNEVPWESIWRLETENGPMILTGGHRVFVSPTEKREAESLEVGSQVLGVDQGKASLFPVLAKTKLSPRRYVFDLTVEDWHNFVLVGSQTVVSNSPDKFYHFRPPEHEGRIGQFNRVFGQIWEDAELYEYLRTALDEWNMAPPETEGLCTIEDLVQQKPAWKAALIWGAIKWAVLALSLNWIADEFSVVGETEVRILLSDGQEVDISIEDLYGILYEDENLKDKIRKDFQEGKLRVRSSTPKGEVRESVVSDVVRHHTPHKKILQVSLVDGRQVSCTEDHSLFLQKEGKPREAEARDIEKGSLLSVRKGGEIIGVEVSSVLYLGRREYTYDLSVPGDQNFVLSNDILAHNSYNIGGISLDIDKSSKYESIKQNAEQQFEKLLEQKTRTTKLIRGLRQPRFGIGVRSAFGPHVSRGVLSPRNFVG